MNTVFTLISQVFYVFSRNSSTFGLSDFMSTFSFLGQEQQYMQMQSPPMCPMRLGCQDFCHVLASKQLNFKVSKQHHLAKTMSHPD